MLGQWRPTTFVIRRRGRTTGSSTTSFDATLRCRSSSPSSVRASWRPCARADGSPIWAAARDAMLRTFSRRGSRSWRSTRPRQMTLRAHSRRSAGRPSRQSDSFRCATRASTGSGRPRACCTCRVHRRAADTARWWGCLGPGGVLGLSTSMGDGEGWEACPYEPADPTARPHFGDGSFTTTKRLSCGCSTKPGSKWPCARERATHRRWLQVLARRRDP